jgi:hypothetical protein
MILIIYPIQNSIDLTQFENLLLILTGIFFLFGIASGGMLSVKKPIGDFLIPLHKIIALLILISSGLTSYLLLFRK